MVVTKKAKQEAERETKIQAFCEENKEMLDELKSRWEDVLISYCKRAFVCDSKTFEDREDYEYYRGAEAAYKDIYDFLEKCKANRKEIANL